MRKAILLAAGALAGAAALLYATRGEDDEPPPQPPAQRREARARGPNANPFAEAPQQALERIAADLRRGSPQDLPERMKALQKQLGEGEILKMAVPPELQGARPEDIQRGAAEFFRQQAKQVEGQVSPEQYRKIYGVAPGVDPLAAPRPQAPPPPQPPPPPPPPPPRSAP